MTMTSSRALRKSNAMSLNIMHKRYSALPLMSLTSTLHVLQAAYVLMHAAESQNSRPNARSSLSRDIRDQHRDRVI